MIAGATVLCVVGVLLETQLASKESDAYVRMHVLSL